jgi:hypothetical protein
MFEAARDRATSPHERAFWEEFLEGPQDVGGDKSPLLTPRGSEARWSISATFARLRRLGSELAERSAVVACGSATRAGAVAGTT